MSRLLFSIFHFTKVGAVLGALYLAVSFFFVYCNAFYYDFFASGRQPGFFGADFLLILITLPWSWLVDGDNPLSFLRDTQHNVALYGLYFALLVLNGAILYFFGWGLGKLFKMVSG